MQNKDKIDAREEYFVKKAMNSHKKINIRPKE